MDSHEKRTAHVLPAIPNLSIVVPAYNEEDNLEEIYRQLIKVLPQLNMNWEVIFVDDGSRDGTWEKIKSIYEKDHRVKGLRFSRNFGHQAALFAGLSYTTGDAVISMDADLQHPPAVIPELIDKWQKGNKIVNTIRLEPEDFSFLKKLTSKVFYKIYSFLSGVQIHTGSADFRLLDRQVVQEILHFKEEWIFLRGIVQWVGYPSANVTFNCQKRYTGKPKYNTKRMIKFAVNAIISFSNVPLRVGIIIGMLTSLVAFYHLVYAVYAKVILKATVPGWATTISILSFMFGILFILLGLIGEYIGRILVEVRSRPRFIVSELAGMRNDSQNAQQLVKSKITRSGINSSQSNP